MSFRVLHIDDTLLARIAALSAMGLIALILFGLGQPAKAADQSADRILPRCSGL